MLLKVNPGYVENYAQTLQYEGILNGMSRGKGELSFGGLKDFVDDVAGWKWETMNATDGGPHMRLLSLESSQTSIEMVAKELKPELVYLSIVKPFPAMISKISLEI